MTGNTTELEKMSEDRWVLPVFTINDSREIHQKGGWTNKWDQEIVDTTYYEKLEGYDYNKIK